MERETSQSRAGYRPHHSRRTDGTNTFPIDYRIYDKDGDALSKKCALIFFPRFLRNP